MRKMRTEGELLDLKLDYKKIYDDQGIGLVPAVILDSVTGKPLMVAFMNQEAVEATRETRMATFWSRTRRELWRKGATSGNVLEVRSWLPDCDSDTIVAWVKRSGPVCHRGTETCFDPETS